MPVDEDDPASDVGAIQQGFVSVTPISLDMTHHRFLDDLSQWEIPARVA